MFHELLAALNGLPGSIFMIQMTKFSMFHLFFKFLVRLMKALFHFKVSSSIPNLNPAEQNILERLCSLGSKCKYLSEFVKTHQSSNAFEKYDMYGLYLDLFCSGLDDVLEVYRHELILMEEEILKDSFLPLTYFLNLEKYQPLLKVLCDIVSELKKEKVHGCGILDLLHKHASSGDSLQEMSINKILQKCHSVMFRQVFCWMMNGYIEDPYLEFFIQPECSEKRNSGVPPFVNTAEMDLKEPRYILKPSLLPSYIPNGLAAKILFVGEYVSVLGAAEDSNAYTLFQKKEHSFEKKIEELLSEPEFSQLSFETTIDGIRKCAAEHLWQLIVKKANVIDHLKIMKDFYLLGRGELFLSFIDKASNLLRMPVTTTAESDVNKIFQMITHQMFPEDDPTTDKFRVILQAKVKKGGEVDKESLSKTKLETGWSSIGLLYDVPHPLHVLITSSTIDRYNVIFRFLLSVRKVQMELHQCWALQMRMKTARHEPSFMLLWQLRSHMSFLIDNFQYYILVDVLESCFSNLMEKMESVKDFEEIQQYHDRFLCSLTSQCFLELHTVYNFFIEIFDLCSSFCSLMNRLDTTITQRDISQFENLKQSFQRKTDLLLRTLSGVRSRQVSPHLAQLLLRIDYNGYFLSSCNQFLGIQKARSHLC
ncbi:gamma-tubulin complex component 4-like [Uloborus diversus]|uniref:gamma-tubulin complex component 4-like n=1 Tax=Uloborus diversus TaxID=327109 RepID=UPI002409AF36|nr:gamma-tubulin complex component 4-like [Uloborus diversus]